MNAFVYNDLKQIYKYCALEFESSNINAVIIDMKTPVVILTAALALLMSLVIDIYQFVDIILGISIFLSNNAKILIFKSALQLLW
jgi:hypothetical protein